MSSYNKETKNPKTGEWEAAYWEDNHFGLHAYGVSFPSDPRNFIDPLKVSLETRESVLPEKPKVDRIKQLRDIVAIQCSPGNYDYDEYMWGMANGLILALAIIENNETEYIDKPEKFINQK